MPFEKINGINIYYEIHGEGGENGTIALLHHGFGCTKMWKEIYSPLVEKGYRVLIYDRRGFGRSDRGVDFLDFYISETFRSLSVDELAALTDMLHIESFHIIGQCEGGVIGVDYAIKYPDQVLTLITASTQCFSKKSMVEINREGFPKPFEELDSELQEKLIDWHGAYAEPFFNQMRKYGGAYGKDFFDMRGVLPAVMCPALVLYPDRSSLFDVEQGVAFYRHLPQGELAVLPYCGHNTYEYRPEQYIDTVLNFLERHDRPSGIPPSEKDALNFTCVAVKKP
ncbi:MAG: alpha/beta hydrolase [Deltaproteobacteria bacterium]|nr:alpha/beta hydrolase [Deltaproteobacteria bacterium]